MRLAPVTSGQGRVDSQRLVSGQRRHPESRNARDVDQRGRRHLRRNTGKRRNRIAREACSRHRKAGHCVEKPQRVDIACGAIVFNDGIESVTLGKNIGVAARAAHQRVAALAAGENVVSPVAGDVWSILVSTYSSFIVICFMLTNLSFAEL